MSDVPAQLRKIVCALWRLTDEQAASLDRQDATWLRAFSLSLSLGALLDESQEAERVWMAAPRKAFEGRCAKDVLMDDDGLAKVEELFRGECP